MRWLLLAAVISCAHAPPPPPKVQRPITGGGSLAGRYTAGNDLDWGFFLTVDDKGVFDLVVDRGKMGRCERKGTLAAGADDHTFALAFTKDECDRDHAGQPLTVHVDSFTADELVLHTTGPGIDEVRHYVPGHFTSA